MLPIIADVLEFIVLVIFPVDVTVSTVFTPPVEFITFELDPLALYEPAIIPTFPVPEKAKAIALVAELRFKELPFSKIKSSLGPPEIVIVLVVVVFEVNVRFVLLIIFICPTVKLTLSTEIDKLPPGVVPAPSITCMSEFVHAVGTVPVPSEDVFQLVKVFHASPVAPIQ